MQDRPHDPEPEQTSPLSPEPDTPQPRRTELNGVPRRAEPPTTPLKSATASGPPTPPTLPAPDKKTASPPDPHWRWPLISLVGILAVVLMNWLANWVSFNGHTTGEVSRANAVPFQPASWAFLIWLLIYGLLFAFVIYSFLPVGRRSSRIRAIGPLFLVANIANISWLLAWHWERFALSLIAIVVLLGSLAATYGVLQRRDAEGGHGTFMQRFLVRGTFSIYLAWISIATLANIEVWMDNGGWNGGPFGLRGWTVIFLLGGLLVAAAFAFLARDAAYPLVFVWGYSAIASEQWNNSALISILAGILAAGAAALTVMAALLAFDARRDPTRPAKIRLPRRNTMPPPPTPPNDSPLSTSR